MFREGKALIIVKFHKADLVTCSHSREGKTPCYSGINMVYWKCAFYFQGLRDLPSHTQNPKASFFDNPRRYDSDEDISDRTSSEPLLK